VFLPGNPAFGGDALVNDWSRAWQQEVRISSSDDEARFGWVFGLFYRDSKQMGTQSIVSNLDPLTLSLFGQTSLQRFGRPNLPGDVANYTETVSSDEQTAIFGEVNYDILSNLN